MKRGSLWKVSVATTAAAEDAVTEALAGLFATTATTHTDARSGRITVSVFLEQRPAAPARVHRRWRDIVRRLNACGLFPGPARLRITRLRRENWAESWKRHFPPLAIGQALLLRPSWSKQKPRPGQVVVVLDPGLSFGTGHHPTTAFCLRELVRRRKSTQPQSFLDIGTGSGILAIAAARLGYSPIRAFDCDPAAVRVAQANARTNRVASKLCLLRADLTRLRKRAAKRYDVVCANLISTLLIAARQRVRQRLKPGGHLVVAGILTTEFAAVHQAFAALGLRLAARQRDGEWTSASFTSPPIGRAYFPSPRQ